MQLNIGGLTISAIFILVCVIAPIGTIVLALLKIIRNRKIISDLGEVISNCSIKNKTKRNIALIYLMIVGIFFAIFTINIHIILGTVAIIFFIQILIDFIVGLKYSKINGIYSSCIIYGNELLELSKIQSYSLTDNGSLTILRNNGLKIDIVNITNKQNVITLFEGNNIKSED